MYYDLENQPLRHARVSMEIPVNYWTISAATLCCLSVSATTLLCDRHLGSSGTALYGSTTVQRHVSVPMASLQQSSVREPVATRLLTSGFDDESGRSKMKINSFSRLQKLPCKGGVECINLVSNGAVLAVTENVALAEQAEDFAAVCLSSLTHFSEPFFSFVLRAFSTQGQTNHSMLPPVALLTASLSAVALLFKAVQAHAGFIPSFNFHVHPP